jgi:hypothetical protein
VDGSAVQQQLFGQGGLARIGVGDDGERSPLRNFGLEGGGHGEIGPISMRDEGRFTQIPEIAA